MAIFPTILVNSATGSDSSTSGAGPATAKTGTAATSTTTTNIDITDTVDLSGVAVDGSAAIYFNDTTAGHRRFAQITNVTGGPSGSTWHITVDSTGVTSGVGPVTWAIGGIRASVGGAVSGLLLSNNSAAGDALPGWTVQMQSAHSETLAAALVFRRSGSSANGLITLQGDPAAGTLPLLTFSNNARGIDLLTASVVLIRLYNFELQNTNVTKTASVAIMADNGSAADQQHRIESIKISHSTNKFWRGIIFAVQVIVRGCEVGYCANTGIDSADSAFNDGQGSIVTENYVHDCGSHGIYSNEFSNSQGTVIERNICARNGGSGIRVLNIHGLSCRHNTCDSNTGAGLYLTQGAGVGVILNNISSNNTGPGFDFNGATAAQLSSLLVDCNNTYNNTGGTYSTPGVATNDPGLNPTYTNAAGGDFSIGTNLRAKGYPIGGTTHVGTTSSTYSYVDIGAAQHQDAGGGGGGGNLLGNGTLVSGG